MCWSSTWEVGVLKSVIQWIRYEGEAVSIVILRVAVVALSLSSGQVFKPLTVIKNSDYMCVQEFHFKKREQI